MKRRGQFYLIAAVVVIGVLAGFSTIYNSTRISPEDTLIYYLSEEINFEASQVLDNSARTEVSEEETLNRLNALVNFYATKNPENEIVTFYATENSVTLSVYNSPSQNTTKIYLEDSTSPLSFEQGSNSSSANVTRIENFRISFSEGNFHNLELRQGKSFVAIIKKEKAGEVFVSFPK